VNLDLIFTKQYKWAGGVGQLAGDQMASRWRLFYSRCLCVAYFHLVNEKQELYISYLKLQYVRSGTHSSCE